MSLCRFVVATVVVAAIVGWVRVAPTAGAAAAVKDLYVAVEGSDTNACTNATEPCHTINHAVSLAAASGTTIHVAKGEYDPVSPGNKNVTVVGAGNNPDPDIGTLTIGSLGVAVAVTDPAAVLTLKSVAFQGDPFGAYVTAGTLNTSHVTATQAPCALAITGGQVTFTDSTIDKSGVYVPPDCRPVSDTPLAVSVTGGSLAMVRSHLTDTKDEPGIVISGGTFSAIDSVFSDDAYTNTNNNAAVQIAGGAATIARSLFQSNIAGLVTTGGSTTVTDSTFYRNEAGISAISGGSQPSVFRSTFVDAELFGPAALAGDVLTNHYGAACSEQPYDLGYNYGTRGGCPFTAPTSHNGITTLNLETAAANHGGPTATVAQAAPSALINTIPVDAIWGPDHRKLCPPGTTDQRGVSRAQGGGCDVGAFEAAASQLALAASPSPASPGATVTLTAKVIPHAGTFHDPDPFAGKVAFTTGSTTLCSGQAVNASGIATCATTKLPTGTSTVTAAFTSTSPYLNSAGTAKLIVGTVPTFTGGTHGKATIGNHKTIIIRASAAPAPTITRISGKLPKGMTFTRGVGSATITGTPARRTAKTYVLHLQASNLRGSATRTFTLTVRPRPVHRHK